MNQHQQCFENHCPIEPTTIEGQTYSIHPFILFTVRNSKFIDYDYIAQLAADDY